MADRLILSEIAVDCRLGVQEWEQRTPQTIWIDIELAIDAAKAAAADDLSQAVDYAALTEAIRQLAQGHPYKLMETLAEEAAALVLGLSRSPWARVRVKKKALTDVGYAAVDVTRLANDPRKSRAVTAGRSRAKSPFPTTGRRSRETPSS